ncbi:MAG: hypothetical protein IJ236_01720 [Oscillospiraceae bacterium]|nr:hypothetical protein [Oscillospiraceae bacterium]MBR1898422.1 hypothetical protein [Oscillospiraceae bacterium]
MKRGITIEYDLKEDCYRIQKQRGTLTLEEIQQALNEHHGEDTFFIFMNTENSYFDEGGIWVDVAPKGDCVKAYTYDAGKRMFEGAKK